MKRFAPRLTLRRLVAMLLLGGALPLGGAQAAEAVAPAASDTTATPLAWKSLRIPKALVVVGAWGDTFRWREAMHAQGLLYDEAYTTLNRSLIGMPETEADYGAYSAIVLLNVETRALGPQRLETIRRFVSQGGGLALFGRSYDFAPDGYAGTPLEAMLPVTVVDEHAFHRQPEGAVLRPEPASARSWKFNFAESPRAFYVQTLVPKQGATVELRAGEQPVMFSWTLGAGRVVACGLTVHGEAPAGSLAFWDWPDWPKLVGETIEWTAAGRPLQSIEQPPPPRPVLQDEIDRLRLEALPIDADLVAQFVAAPTAPAAALIIERAFVEAQANLALSAAVVDALAPYVQPDHYEPLLKMADSLNPDFERRRAALELLGATRASAAGDYLVKALADRDVVVTAVDGLRRLDDPKYVPVLKRLYQQRLTGANFRNFNTVGIDMRAAERNGVVAVHAAAALYRLGDPDGARRMTELFQEIRLLRRVFANATKFTSKPRSEAALEHLRLMYARRNNMISLESFLLAMAGPVPASQQKAFVEFARGAADDAEVRWLTAALLQTPADRRWAGLSQAKDGIVRRLGSALAAEK